MPAVSPVSRYSKTQISAGVKARRAGKTNREVAEAAGVKSPQYFSKVITEEIARRSAASKKQAKPSRVVKVRKTK